MSERDFLVVDTTARKQYPAEALAQLGDLNVRFEPRRATSDDEVIEVAQDADAILVTAAYVTRRALEALQPKLRAVVRYGIGLDRIDLDAARELGVQIRNVPDFCIVEVADHAIALMLAVARDIVPRAVDTQEGRWRGTQRKLHRIAGRTAGIVGIGGIGGEVAKRLAGFGLTLIAHDPYADAQRAEALGVRLVEIDELLSRADFVMLTCPLTDETEGMIDREALAMMKPDAIIVNTSRGELIDEEALAQALAEGRIGGAGLDVLAQEPAPDDHPLLSLENVVITPHVAWYSEEARQDLVFGAMRELGEVLREL